ncbi:MAG TPA: cell division protein FtsL [Candidatus Methylomirabilis sp.]|nr:cell division protein FtsL [Candidatus Methylomirabilis sp.]
MSSRAARSPASRSRRAGWNAASEQQAARFHRERDRRRMVAMGRALIGAVVLVSLVLGVVALRVQQVRLSYSLDVLRGIRAELEETRSRLRVERASLTALARVEVRAREELGMVPPARDQVRLAREFVPAGGGLSMISPLTAAAEDPVPQGPGAVER